MDGARNIEELQTKLDGVYDLTQVDDCRKMIEVLLRSIRDRDTTAQQAQDRLKMLALMVTNDNPEAKDKAREALSNSGKSKAAVWDFLMKMVRTMEAAEAMPTEQLLSEVMNTIWAEFDMSSRESSILGELIYRVKKLIALSQGLEAESLRGG